MTDERFTVEVTISAPVEEVWRALRDPEQIRRWHGWHFDGLDKEIELIYAEHVTESPEEHWVEVQGGDRFELADAGEGRTLLRMTRAPLSGDTEWDAYYDDVNEGWVTFVHQLKFALERHPGADRRTVFLSGPGATPPLTAAGLDALAGLAPGAPYEHAAPTGEPLAGTVWYRTDRQLGLTVDGWGDGLLVLTHTPPVAVHPEGGAMMVLTTYGQSDEEFAALEARWNAWWSQAVPAA
ncbi:SRPBCC domain-containing protein [Nonomuraea sp. MCN248]|uniref:SRPBCC domain-containing protein n=1 Tax=Nonomuraea corallina TaxID=2989783 RepID=A0ABT4SHH2_9ACTN|nr:SRPBCC domain-containing protein [Nonomuraea corallina]MDA0636652.1 SRPBCC domain-containing protein [Nonomuraea corallina]